MSTNKTFDPIFNELNLDASLLRFTTPKNIADYRAYKLKCNNIIDISCGIGGQTMYFAKYSNHVYSIDIDPKKIKIAKKICQHINLNNITFICGNALSSKVIDKIEYGDIIFSDPERPVTEEKRNLYSMSPNIDSIIQNYKHLTSNFAFEVPPQIKQNLLPKFCEKEYISFNGKVNRLTLYFGNIKKHDLSIITLPSRYKIGFYNSTIANPNNYIGYTKTPRKYLYEIDPSIGLANVMFEFLNYLYYKFKIFDIKIINIDKKRTLLTSNFWISNYFIINKYILLKCIKADYHSFLNDSEQMNSFVIYLNSIKAKKIFLRGFINPNEYWAFRNRLEETLSNENNKIIHLYLLKDLIFVCKVI